MKDPSMTKPELIKEISSLRQRIKELEQSELERLRTAEELRESEEKYRILTHRDPLTIAKHGESVPVSAGARAEFSAQAKRMQVELAAAAQLVTASAQ